MQQPIIEKRHRSCSKGEIIENDIENVTISKKPSVKDENFSILMGQKCHQVRHFSGY